MPPGPASPLPGPGFPWLRRRRHRSQLLVLAAGLMVLAVVPAMLLLKAEASVLEYAQAIGYPGVFLLSLTSSASLILPIPGLLGVCGATGLGLNIYAVALLSGLGETVGEMTGYAIGYGGRGAVERRRSYRRVARWMQRRGTIVLFLVSVVPNPFFDLIGIAAGGTRFPLRRFLVTVFAGKSLKGLLVAYSCLQGVRLLPWFE